MLLCRRPVFLSEGVHWDGQEESLRLVLVQGSTSHDLRPYLLPIGQPVLTPARSVDHDDPPPGHRTPSLCTAQGLLPALKLSLAQDGVPS